jgi:putative transcriptional regulator
MNQSKVGKLLIADPMLTDANFQRSVILICEHDAQGSFGLQLNKKVDFSLGDIFTELYDLDIELYMGGPVQLDTLHFIHQLPKEIPNSIQLSNNLYWGGDFEVVKQLIIDNQIDLSKIRFFIGYSGWSPGQLEQELNSPYAWIEAKALQSLVFSKQVEHNWTKAMESLGGDYKWYANAPLNPQWN